MSDEYQIEIPQSFMALYVDPGRHKPNASREFVASRYELCEDMASMLTEHARDMSFRLDITKTDVLVRCLQGLEADAAAVTEKEAEWVIRRLAELLDWTSRDFADVE